MIGKKNIVFGFIYLVLTAALGPYMIKNSASDVGAALQEKQTPVGRIQKLKESGFEEELEPLKGEQIAKANTDAILALNKVTNLESPHARFRSTHAHGNLEAVLNILAGLVLCFIALAPLYKQIISWIFIAGALLHSGMIYLSVAFELEIAGKILGTGIGAITVLVSLLSIGIAAAIGFKGQIVQDK